MNQFRFFRFHSIATQLFFLFSIGMIVPVLVGGYLSYIKSTQIVEEQVSKIALLTITQVSDKINLIFKKLEDTTMMVLYSEDIEKALEGGLPEYERELINKVATNYVSSLMTNSSEILDIYIFDHKKQNSIFGSTITLTDLWESNWYKAIIKAEGRSVWFGLSNKSYLRAIDTGIPVFGLGRAIKSKKNGDIIGVIFIEVRGTALTKELENVQFGTTGFTYVVDSTNQYIYHPNDNLYGTPSDFVYLQKDEIHRIEDKNILMIPDTLSNEWHVTGVVPVQELIADSVEIRNLTVWIVLASILYAILMGYLVTRRIGQPLVKLSRLMKKSEAGDLTARIHISGRNELSQLGRSFNKMIQQIDALIQRIGEEESQKKMAEIRALRYQINPHFLYNTLNSIRWMAKLNRTEDVVNAISTLVQLLEGSLQRNGPFIELGDELDLLEKYMLIQQYRYGNQISLVINCSEKSKKIMIPRMLLQPIIENAIFHGIAPKDDLGIIEIDVTQDENDVLIIIKDDGIGIDPEKIPYLLTVESETRTKGMTSIGLRHVHQTVQLHYGAQYGISVSSVIDVGTEVQLAFSTSKGDDYVQGAVS